MEYSVNGIYAVAFDLLLIQCECGWSMQTEILTEMCGRVAHPLRFLFAKGDSRIPKPNSAMRIPNSARAESAYPTYEDESTATYALVEGGTVQLNQSRDAA